MQQNENTAKLVQGAQAMVFLIDNRHIYIYIHRIPNPNKNTGPYQNTRLSYCRKAKGHVSCRRTGVSAMMYSLDETLRFLVSQQDMDSRHKDSGRCQNIIPI